MIGLRHTIDIFNEPYPWDEWLVPTYNGGGIPWFGRYIGMSNDADYYNKYIALCNQTITALGAVKPNILIIIDPLNIVQCNLGESDDVNLQGIESHGHLIGNEFNKIESLILEGTKPVYV